MKVEVELKKNFKKPIQNPHNSNLFLDIEDVVLNKT